MALRQLALALLVVAGLVAGVAAVSSTLSGDADPGTSTPTSQYDPDGPYARGFEPPYEPDRVFVRVERLRGVESNYSVPISTYRKAEERVHHGTRDVPDEFAEIDGLGARLLLVRSNASVRPGVPLGFADRQGDATVVVHQMTARDLPDGLDQRAVLAHEFVHVLQFELGVLGANGTDPPAITDRLYAWWAVKEGDAMITTLAYQRRYGVEGIALERYRGIDEPRGAWPSEFSSAYYYYGTRYLQAINATGERRTALLRDPPESTRLLLHPDATPVNRTLQLPFTLAEESFVSIDHDRFGELAIRRAFRVNGLGPERAAAAATGWRDGYVSYYYDSGGDPQTGAWRTRWANASEAREFLAAYRRTLRGLNGTRTGETWRVATRTTPETFVRVQRRGATVTVVGGANRSLVRRVATALPAANASTGG